MNPILTLLAALLLAPLAALHAADVRTEAWTEKWPDKTGQLQGAAEIEKAISKHKLRPLLSFPAARKVHLSDFGAAADGKQDDYPALRKAIQSLLAQNDDGSAVELIFPKGTYRFNAPAHEVVFVLNERSNIIINGNHSEFRFSNAFTRLGEFKKCNNIIIKDFTIKYDNVGQIVGEITDVNLSDDTAPYIIVRAEEPYVESLTHSAKVFSDYDSSSGRRPYDHFYLAREVNGEYVPYSTVNSKPFKVINSNTVKIPFAAKRVVPEAIQTGLKVLMPNRGSRMLLPGGTDNLTVSGLKVHGYSGAFIFAISCVNLSVLNCEFISDGKGFSLCAGGIISVNSYGHWLEGNIINGCSDDGINIVNTAPIFVRDRISPNVLKMDSDARHLNVNALKEFIG